MRNSIFALFSLAALVAGCASKPNLDSIVYRNFGPDALLLPAQGAAPFRNSRSNDYNYPPGTLLRRVAYTPPDILRGRAGFFTSRIRFCRQLSIFLADTSENRFADIEEISNFSFSLFGRNQAVRSFVDELGFPDLPDQTLAWIDYASLKLKNIRSYELTELQLSSLVRGNTRFGRCNVAGLRARDPYSHIVKRIYVADIEADLVLKSGASAKALDARAKLVRAMSSSFRGRRIVFAMSVDRYQQVPLVAFVR